MRFQLSAPADNVRGPRYMQEALIDGMPSRPFSLQTLPPPSLPNPDERRRIVRESSGRRHAAPAERVHAEIRRAFENL